MELLFDISKWNIFDDYHLLGERTVGGFIKATEGSWSDPLFHTHWRETKEEGLLRGPYHFWRPDRTAQEQAQNFFQVVQGSADLGELPPVLDVEMLGDPDDVRACLVEIEALFGKRPIVYTALGIWNSLGDTPWAQDYPLWVANYIGDKLRWSETLLAEVVGANRPFVPSAWANAGWVFWQFSQKGHGPDFGLDWDRSKNIDLNVYPGTLQELGDWVGIVIEEDVSSEDPWATEPLPSIGRKVRVIVPGLNLRNAPIVLDDNFKDVMSEGDQTTITNVFKDDNYIWCETGYRQWFAFKRRDGTRFAIEL